MNITVLSDGGWGTSLANVLCDNGNKVTMWGPFPDYIEEMKETRENSRFLKGYPLPESLILEGDIEKALENTELILLASPSQFLRSTLDQLKPFYDKNTPIVNVAKGIENDTLLRMSELCSNVLGECNFAVLSGPSHAEEVVKKVPTLVVVASKNETTAETVKKAFMNDYLRIYTSDDVISVELGGALKNVMAVAAGIIDGMQLGDNPKAALITRGIAEMARLGVALGGDNKTFSGLSGIGDMIVTCASGHSRNRFVGEELGKGRSLEDITSEMGMVVAEGVKTSKSAYELAKKINIEVPIINEVYEVLYNGKNSKTAVYDLMTRKSKGEFE